MRFVSQSNIEADVSYTPSSSVTGKCGAWCEATVTDLDLISPDCKLLAELKTKIQKITLEHFSGCSQV